MVTLNGRTSRADKPVPEAVRLAAEAQHKRWAEATAAKAAQIESGEVVLKPFVYMPKAKSKKQVRAKHYRG